jgi:hypothetical protein
MLGDQIVDLTPVSLVVNPGGGGMFMSDLL